MVGISKILFFALSASAAILPRTVAQIKTDLQTINTDTQALTQKVNAYDGTVGGANGQTVVQQAEKKVESDIDNADTDTKNTPAASSSDSASIISYINSTLEPTISGAITAIINQKSKFVAGGLKTLVQNDLASLKSKTQTLGNDLIAKSSSDQSANAQTALNKVIADIQRGIDAYA